MKIGELHDPNASGITCYLGHQIADSNGNKVTIGDTEAHSQIIQLYTANQGEGYTGPGSWHEIWYSDFMRTIIPDMLGIHIGATLVPTVGVGYSFNFDLMTRGRDAGFHMSQTLSLRAGEEAGVSISGVNGHYNGDANYATYDGIMGWGGDLNGALGPVNFGVWGSFDTTNKRVSWEGTSIGTGLGIGGSGGVSYTWPIK